ncbi:ATP-binding cassette domain-containing protein [Paludibaculum fermentans]|uniref:ATP-binding cassette domain-containing protein n=1 Tax=Paludibaculum fermentans TaxID=1473598 RepID=A0A7S7NW58_PALFE|nr:ATP-binding cassette domain-containing protein [Paludibaculum fermentans]QOY90902.1 ATP-binding cassette domain-containing protein [Paludibaculum fermentans]
MIQLEALTRRFDGQRAVDSVSLEVAEGELLVLLGGSGSGKTTTLKMINRLIEPTSGRVLLSGENVAGMKPYELRRRIGYVFQRIGLFPHMTVAENIAITPVLLGWDRDRIRSRVDELLELVELGPAMYRDRRPEALSGGQAQRVAVARALAAEPRVMLLDEPFGALDPLTRGRLQQSFLRIRQTLGLTAIFVTHDVMEAILLGDRIAVMDSGRVKQVGTARELLDSPVDESIRALINAPWSQAEIASDRVGRGHGTTPA